VTHVRGADRRGWRQRSPVVSGGVREGESMSEAAAAPIGGPGRTVPGGTIHLGLNQNEIQPGSN
jgi:hypothetical protein